MKDKVYSFTKVRKQHTKSGIYGLAFGLVSVAVLLFLLALEFIKPGK